MIIDKYTECIDCAEQGDHSLKPTIAGRCKMFHYNSYRRKITIQKQNARQQANKAKYLPSNKKMLEEKGIVKNNELELWFLQGMNTSMPICENCGSSKSDLLNPLLKKQWRSCQAHLLPKRHFKSIMTHPLSRLILGSGFSGMCHCHDNYDHDWGRASKMDIWPEVIRRFKILYPFIDQKEYQFIPDALIPFIPEQNQDS